MLQSREAPPAIVLATAHVELAALLEGSGERARAIAHYRLAAETAGGDPEARARARDALKRLAS
ncbi:MAG: hypothetical protein AB7I13_03045 [Vicinamibacterales bacterium]